MAKYRPYATITATFRPRRADDLHPNAKPWVGYTGEWLASWVIEDGDYAGQWAFTPREHLTPFPGWVPECDLVLAEAPDYARAVAVRG